MMRP
jgi:quinoprotein glucose dehydrogenase